VEGPLPGLQRQVRGGLHSAAWVVDSVAVVVKLDADTCVVVAGRVAATVVEATPRTHLKIRGGNVVMVGSGVVSVCTEGNRRGRRRVLR